MKLNIVKEVFVVVPAGPLVQVDDFVFCPDRSSADKEVDNEMDMSGQRMVVLPCTITIPVVMQDGQLLVPEAQQQQG
jgi:hypothetical protein